MASSREYMEYIMEQLSGLSGITARQMMGEYIIYYRDRVAGGIYDNRLLVKPVEAAKRILPEAEADLPYEGAKPMLRVDDVDDRELLTTLFKAMFDELPVPKKKKRG